MNETELLNEDIFWQANFPLEQWLRKFVKTVRFLRQKGKFLLSPMRLSHSTRATLCPLTACDSDTSLHCTASPA